MRCPRCGDPVERCPRRAALCRWLCDGWQHLHGTHHCRGDLTGALAARPVDLTDIADIGPGWEVWREMRDADGLDPWAEAA
jgi:hypothetical protein